ncbi:SIP domain-containing protein [Nonomuraea aridisoli]|uniref:SIP domain-containing protein n=1 Tax=Nonomuraea aridisoli TaxID=2070368 RepID=UPI001F33BA2C|nr:SIP domain-containing protein [Nonomuraea aridisoli]
MTDTGLVTPTMRRIRPAADEPIAFPYRPGQHIRVQLNDPLSVSGMLLPLETLRTYTIWDLGPDRRALELRAHLYDGDGIGLRWAREVAPGDPVTFWWPQSDFHTRDDAPFHLFAGEETASVAFGPMIRALGSEARVHGVLESESSEHDMPLSGPHELARVHRKGASVASSATLVSAVAALDLPGNTGAAYLAGEALTCRLIRDHLVRDRNWPRKSIKVKPFWTPGKRGLHLDENGRFHAPDRIPDLLATARIEEVELEFRAQIDAVAAAGLTPTHLDWRCLADGGRDDVFDLTVAPAGLLAIASTGRRCGPGSARRGGRCGRAGCRSWSPASSTASRWTSKARRRRTRGCCASCRPG